MGRRPGRTRLITPRERIYLIDAANGLTTRQIAEKHTVSANTVATLLKSAKRALKADNITHAVALAIFHGEITIRNLKGLES